MALSFLLACSAPVTAPLSGSSSSSSAAPSAAPAAHDLGTAPAGTPITFDVPDGTLGFTIIADASVTIADYLGVVELRDPSGRAVVADFLDPREPGHSMSGQNGTGLAVLRVPLVSSHAEEPVPAGRWTVTFGGVTQVPGGGKGATTPWTGAVHGAVQLQVTRDGAFHGGAIDLDVYVPDGLLVHDDAGASRAIDATAAASAPALTQRLDGAFELFHRLYGIDRGEVRFHRVAAAVASITGQEGVDAANRLATAPHASAQIILTNRLDPDDNGGQISGITNCMPGAVGVPSTTCSAVIVALRDGAPAWEDASVIVHELGHFVGLHHTTEFEGTTDELTDTAACTNTTKSALASCPDRANLMFPSVNFAGSEAASEVSSSQRALFRSSLLYRAAR
jgi:hypothetical protein